MIRMPGPHRKGLIQCSKQHAFPDALLVELSGGVYEQLENLVKLAVPKLKRCRECVRASSVFARHYRTSLLEAASAAIWGSQPKVLHSQPAAAEKTRTWCSQLPIFQKQHELLTAIQSNQCVVVAGLPGCGKSTQIVQYIMDELRQTAGSASAALSTTRRPCSIVQCVAEDIVAQAIAGRVAHESADTLNHHSNSLPQRNRCPF